MGRRAAAVFPRTHSSRASIICHPSDSCMDRCIWLSYTAIYALRVRVYAHGVRSRDRWLTVPSACIHTCIYMYPRLPRDGEAGERGHSSPAKILLRIGKGCVEWRIGVALIAIGNQRLEDRTALWDIRGHTQQVDERMIVVPLGRGRVESELLHVRSVQPRSIGTDSAIVGWSEKIEQTPDIHATNDVRIKALGNKGNGRTETGKLLLEFSMRDGIRGFRIHLNFP